MRIPARVSTSTKPYATLTARDLLDGIKSGSAHDAFNLARRVERVLAIVGQVPCGVPSRGLAEHVLRALNGEE